jgi:hypothetical protein
MMVANEAGRCQPVNTPVSQVAMKLIGLFQNVMDLS